MDPPDDRLIGPASPPTSDAIRASAANPSASAPGVENENPFQIQPPLTFAAALQRGLDLGGTSFWVLGLAISAYLLIVAPERTWVDWILRPLIFPIFLGMVGSLLGSALSVFYWLYLRLRR